MDEVKVLLKLESYEEDYYNYLYAVHKEDQRLTHPEMIPELPEDFEMCQINEMS